MYKLVFENALYIHCMNHVHAMYIQCTYIVYTKHGQSTYCVHLSTELCILYICCMYFWHWSVFTRYVLCTDEYEKVHPGCQVSRWPGPKILRVSATSWCPGFLHPLSAQFHSLIHRDLTRKGPSIAPHPHVDFEKPAPSPAVGSWIRSDRCCSFPWDLTFLSDPQWLLLWENAYWNMLSKCAHFQWWHLQHLCPVDSSAGKSPPCSNGNIKHCTWYRIQYCVQHDTDIVHDIDVRYLILIKMEDYVLVLSYVYFVPLIYLNSLLKGYPRWSRSFQRNGKAFQSQVEVFLIDVHPIWHTTQEVMKWSRIGSRELSCRNILVSVITRSLLLSIDGERGTLAPALELKLIYWQRYRVRCRVQYWGRSKNTLVVHTRYCSSVTNFLLLVCRKRGNLGGLKPTSYLLFCEAVYLTGIPYPYYSSCSALELCYRKPSWVFDLHHTKTHAGRFPHTSFITDISSIQHAGLSTTMHWHAICKNQPWLMLWKTS
jgi:hypothetical protein